jgi:hypothetical protein
MALVLPAAESSGLHLTDDKRMLFYIAILNWYLIVYPLITSNGSNLFSDLLLSYKT